MGLFSFVFIIIGTTYLGKEVGASSLSSGQDLDHIQGANIDAVLAYFGDNSQYSDLKSLLETNRDINRPLPNGDTPLVFAIRKGDIELTRLILKAGADPNRIVSEYDQVGIRAYPLKLAVQRGSAEMVALLFEYGATVEDDLPHMRPQFSEYFENLNEHILDMLLGNGYQMEEPDGRGDTALAWAVRNDHYNVAKLLIDKGANVNYKRGYSNLLMRCPDNEEFVDLLLEHGVDVNERNYSGETAVFYAIMSGHWRKAKALIQSSGFNVSIRSNRGTTALDLLNSMYSENHNDLRIEQNGSLEIRQLLLDAAAAAANNHVNNSSTNVDNGAARSDDSDQQPDAVVHADEVMPIDDTLSHLPVIRESGERVGGGIITDSRGSFGLEITNLNPHELGAAQVSPIISSSNQTDNNLNDGTGTSRAPVTDISTSNPDASGEPVSSNIETNIDLESENRIPSEVDSHNSEIGNPSGMEIQRTDIIHEIRDETLTNADHNPIITSTNLAETSDQSGTATSRQSVDSAVVEGLPSISQEVANVNPLARGSPSQTIITSSNRIENNENPDTDSSRSPANIISATKKSNQVITTEQNINPDTRTESTDALKSTRGKNLLPGTEGMGTDATVSDETAEEKTQVVSKDTKKTEQGKDSTNGNSEPNGSGSVSIIGVLIALLIIMT